MESVGSALAPPGCSTPQQQTVRQIDDAKNCSSQEIVVTPHHCVVDRDIHAKMAIYRKITRHRFLAINMQKPSILRRGHEDTSRFYCAFSLSSLPPGG
ncbi:hypothetical protein BS78_06G134600 [Paspalum vaginatum]|nr:hypothetical protein BS78_06G134600 [Paspalum vaginatum]KAJ1271534.1 hypothetical protein BS78_06G134600 [Paspalum vaginatum]